MYIPELKENAYSPEYIHQKILKYMSTMVRHEINLIVWEVGNAVLRRRTSTDRWVEAFMGASTYNYGRAESAECASLALPPSHLYELINSAL